jgi:hypothetical protein
MSLGGSIIRRRTNLTVWLRYYLYEINLHSSKTNLSTNEHAALQGLEILRLLSLRFVRPRPSMPPLRLYLGRN